MPTKVDLLYGRGTLPLTIKDAWNATVIRKPQMPLVEDPTEAIHRSFENPVQSRRLVEADLRIATGLVEPHLMAGFSGGRKVIVPGVAHRETITTLHNASFMEHPRVGNPALAIIPEGPYVVPFHQPVDTQTEDET